MATNSNSGASRPARKTKGQTRPRRSPAAGRSKPRRATSAAATPSAPPSRTRVAQAQDLARRSVLVPVGASLVAQETLVATVKGLAAKYGTLASVEHEINRYERRGASARNRFERQVSRTRTMFERELRESRGRVERTVEQNRRRVEREVRSVRNVIA